MLNKGNKKLSKPDVTNTSSSSFKRTYDNVENGFVKVFRFISNWVDRILFSDRYGKLVAVSLATIICVIVNTGVEGNIFTNNMKSAVELEGISVVTNISDSTYEVENLPETVSVTITGETNDVQNAMQQKANYQVLANLSELGEGTHEVKLEPINFSSKVNVTVQPNVVVVTVRKKVSRSFNLGYEFINTNKMDKIYSLSTPELAQNEVIVRASEERLEEVAYVKALIDVSGVKADFEQEATIVAYNQKGETLDVDILPSKINAKVNVSSPHKEVPIVVKFTGDLPDGRAVSAYEQDKKTVVLYGSQEVLSNIDEITVQVPLTQVTQDMETKRVTVPLMLPTGTAVKGDSVTITVDVTFGKAETKTINNVPVEFVNWNPGLQLASDMPFTINVKVKGMKEQIESIKASDIKVVADMQEYGFIGIYDVSLTIQQANPMVQYSMDNDVLEIEIIEGE